MEYALLTLALLMTTGDARPDGDRVTVRGMNQRLQLTGWQATWEAKAEIQPPVHPVPGGRMIALLKQGDGKRDIVLWSKEGRELARTALALAGEVMASRVFDKRLVLTTTSEVGEFDTANLHPGRVRKLSVSPGKDAKYLPGPTGVWVVNDQALSYHDLDGRPPLEKKRPLATATNKPPCPETGYPREAPCSAGFQPQECEMLVSDVGELLMLDVFKELYPVKPAEFVTDQVWPSVTTVLDSNGNVVAQKVSSWMKKTREWFWSVPSAPNNPTGLAEDWGLVRTRYTTRGIGPGRLFGSRGSDFLYWLEDDDEMTIYRWSRQMKPIWERRIQNLAGGFVFTPSWVSPMLFHDFICFKFSTLSDRGRATSNAEAFIDEIAREKSRTHGKRPRFAIGQSTEGDWLLIAY